MNRIVRAVAVFGAVAVAAPVFALGLEGCKKKDKGGTTRPPQPQYDAGKNDAGKPPPQYDAGKNDAGKPPPPTGDGGKAALLPKAGVTALSHRSQARDTGSEELEGVTCDAANEGAAWCTDESRLTVCLNGRFYKLECAATGNRNVCAEEVDNTIVDCSPIEETD